MGRLTAYLWSRFKEWDRPSQTGFVLAIILFILALIVAAAGPARLRQPATIGAIGLIIAMQVLFMWANRGMVTPLVKAQRHFKNGDFEAARGILEELRAENQIDFRGLTLLGNTYRQLGALDQSEIILREALERQPDHPFPLYGLGRSLLCKGNFTDAARMIERAWEHGAPDVIQFDAGEAYYRLGDTQRSIGLLQRARAYIHDEPHRTLMTAYLLYRMDMGDPPSADLIDAGLPYWVTQARLFASTPYGELLAQDIERMRMMRSHDDDSPQD